MNEIKRQVNGDNKLITNREMDSYIKGNWIKIECSREALKGEMCQLRRIKVRNEQADKEEQYTGNKPER